MRRPLIAAIAFAVASLLQAFEFPISEPPVGVAPHRVSAVAVASNGRNFLVVWTTFGVDTAVMAMRVDGAGKPLDHHAVRIGIRSTGHLAAASNGVDYLVVYADVDHALHGAIVREDGTSLPLPYTIAAQDWEVSLTWSGSKYVAGYTDENYAESAAVIAADGALVNGHQPVIVASAYRSPPAVRFVGGAKDRVLFVWNGFDNHLRSGVLDTAALASGSVAPFRESLLPVGGTGNFAATATGTGYAVAWMESLPYTITHPTTTRELRFRLLDETGQPVGNHLVIESIPENQLLFLGPEIVWTGSQLLVSYGLVDPASGTSTLRAVAMNADGSAQVQRSIADLASAGLLATAQESNKMMLLAWIERNSVVRTALVDPVWGRVDGSGPGTVVSLTSPMQSNPAIVACGNLSFAVWEEWSDQSRVVGGRIGPNGERLDVAGIRLRDSAVPQTRPAIACDGRDALAVWREVRPPYTDGALYGATFAHDGTIGSAFLIGNTKDDAPAAVAWNGSQYLIAWAANVILLQRWTGDGQPIDTVPVVLRQAQYPLFDSNPALAWDGNEYLLLWEESQWVLPPGVVIEIPPTLIGAIEGVRLTKNLFADGAVIHLTDADLTLGVSDLVPRLAAGADGFIAAWWRQTDWGAKTTIVARRLSSTAEPQPGDSEAILGPSHSIVSVAWSGRDYRVLFDSTDVVIDRNKVETHQVGSGNESIVAITYRGTTPLRVFSRGTEQSTQRLYGEIPIGRQRVARSGG